MANTDSSGRHTGRFSGVQWDPPNAWRSKSYLDGKTQEGLNNPNFDKFKDYVPCVYGTSVYVDDPPIASVIGEANSTRFKLLLCNGWVGTGLYPATSPPGFGDGGAVAKVIVNDVLIPQNWPPGSVKDPLFRWDDVTDGSRNGVSNLDDGYKDPSGAPVDDPFGNIKVIEVVCPKSLVESSGLPRVKVLMRGPKVRIYTSPTAFSTDFTDNPIWIMLDLLVRGPYLYADIDIQSFIDAAVICDWGINFTNLAGVTDAHKRFMCSLVIRQRRSLAEIIRGLRTSCKAMLIPNSSNGGLLRAFIKQTLADQQPAAIPGSNDTAGHTSKNFAGNSGAGFVAYAFDEGCIALDDSGRSTLRINQKSIAESPNSVGFSFQDIENQNVVDSINSVDTVDIGRVQQAVSASLPIDGVNNYDQANRVIQTYFAEAFRGNPRGDSGGTMTVSFATGIKVAHLQLGQIVSFTYQPKQIVDQLFRVTSIKPTLNHERTDLTLQWHEDDWYTDAYGQGEDPYFSANNKDGVARPPYGWQPYKISPIGGDPMLSPTEFTFALSQAYDTAADGSAIAKVNVSGRLPINSVSTTQPPLLNPHGTSASTGGGIAGGQTYYAFVCALDATTPSALTSAPQRAAQSCKITAAGGAGTFANTLTIPVEAWAPGTTGYKVYAGPDPSSLTYQTGGSGTPASITLTALNVRTMAVPDLKFDHLEFAVKRVIHSGIFAQQITDFGTRSLTIAGAGWTGDQWADYNCSILARPIDLNGNLPLWNFKIDSNSTDTLNLNIHGPDLATLGIEAGSLVVIRFKPDTFDATSIGDSQFGSLYSITADSEKGQQIRILTGTGRGQLRAVTGLSTAGIYTIDRPWDQIPDANSTFIVEESGWQTTIDMAAVSNNDQAGLFQADIELTNYQNKTLLLEARTADSSGKVCLPGDCIVRDFYLAGSRGGNAGYWPVPIVLIGGVPTATPDLSKGPNQEVLLTADTAIADPINGYTGLTWTLIIDEDATGNWTASPDPAKYFTNTVLQSQASTRSQINWVIDAAGRNSVSGAPSIGEPIPS